MSSPTATIRMPPTSVPPTSPCSTMATVTSVPKESVAVSAAASTPSFSRGATESIATAAIAKVTAKTTATAKKTPTPSSKPTTGVTTPTPTSSSATTPALTTTMTTPASATIQTSVSLKKSASSSTTPKRNHAREVSEEGRHYAKRTSGDTPLCLAHTPTLEELQSMTFSEYVRQVVLDKARMDYNWESEDEEGDEGDNDKNHKKEKAKVEVAKKGEEETKEEAKQEPSEEDKTKTPPPAARPATRTSTRSSTKATPKETTPSKAEQPPQNQPQPVFPREAVEYAEGIGKVTLPKGFWKEEGIGQDRTGRGPKWQKGTPLGDMVIPNPIEQCIRGIGGVYEYTLLDKPAIALHEFREKADAYRKEQLGHRLLNKKKKEEEEKRQKDKDGNNDKSEDSADENDNTQDDNNEDGKSEEAQDDGPTIAEMERMFWKRLGPTMQPAMYGADMEASLFGDDPASGWNLGKLDNFLQVLGPSLPGVTSPYLYVGMWASVFCVHTEDMNLLSINYLHAGAPKIWYGIAPGADSQRFEALCEHHYSYMHRGCKEFLRHKRCLISPLILKKAGLRFTMQIQRPGDAVITFPGGYHFGFNTGFNVAEATNFGVPEWMPFGYEAKVCMCRPDSVRIDMLRLERLLLRYRRDCQGTTRRRRKSWRDWGLLQHQIKRKREGHDDESESESEDSSDEEGAGGQQNNKRSKQPPRKRDFWVEVMIPVSSQRKFAASQEGKTRCPSKKKHAKKRKQEPVEEKEIWHLAKPMTRKGLVLNAKVLVMVPGIVTTKSLKRRQNRDDSSDSDSDEEEDEQCFAGTITEFTEEHCRVHFDRLPKDDDVWMHIESRKLFLDGGRWDESHEKKGIKKLHYWQEMDSKRRCV